MLLKIGRVWRKSNVKPALPNSAASAQRAANSRNSRRGRVMSSLTGLLCLAARQPAARLHRSVAYGLQARPANS